MSQWMYHFVIENSMLWFTLNLALIIVPVLWWQQRKQWHSKVSGLQEMLNYKQGLLDMTYWATGDMIVESKLDEGKAHCLNNNPDLNLNVDIPHFYSDDYVAGIHKDDRAFARSQYEKILNSRDNIYELHYRHTNAQGQVLWIVEKGTVLQRNPQGKATCVLSSFRDVTSFKQEQDKLAQLATEFERRLKLAEAAQLSDL